VDNKEELLRVGLAMVRNGFSVIPINPKTKRPFAKLLPPLLDENERQVMAEGVDEKTGEVYTYGKTTWKPYQENLATESEVRRWVEYGAQLAMVCGAASRGALIIDFDMFNGKTENLYEEWAGACEADGYPVRKLPTQRTGSGGWQVALRCDNPGENTKLAWVEDTGESLGRKVAIETRGSGGYAVIAPSRHPSGNLYQMVAGQFYQTPQVTQAGADAILAIARSFNRVTETVREYTFSERRTDIVPGEGVIDRYNAAFSVRDVLAIFGYKDAGERMHRPGAERTSQPSVVIEKNRSFHHSSNDKLSDGYWHTPFDVRCQFEFGGDASAAVKVIAEELGLKRKAAEPAMVRGVAYCPHHTYQALAKGRKRGWYCRERVGTGYCDFWWDGDGYEPAETTCDPIAVRREYEMAIAQRRVRDPNVAVASRQVRDPNVAARSRWARDPETVVSGRG